jgi:hypothetical protein
MHAHVCAKITASAARRQEGGGRNGGVRSDKTGRPKKNVEDNISVKRV